MVKLIDNKSIKSLSFLSIFLFLLFILSLAFIILFLLLSFIHALAPAVFFILFLLHFVTFMLMRLSDLPALF